MNLGSISISNESQNFNDYRYKKALKQISKLINVNKQIKTQSQKYKCHIEQMNQKYQQLLQINSKYENEVNLYKEKIQNLQMSYCELQQYSQKLQIQCHELKNLGKTQQYQKLSLRQEINSQFQHIEQLNQKLAQLTGQLLQKQTNQQSHLNLQSNLSSLQAQNNKLHQQYQLSLQQIQSLKKKLNENKNIQVKGTKNQLLNQELINKLRINQEWIKSLNQENYALKQKNLQEQYKKQKEKCNQTIFRHQAQMFLNGTMLLTKNNNNAATDIIIKELIHKMQKKIKKLDQDKQKLDSKYAKNKGKCMAYQKTIAQQQKQINLLYQKNRGYQLLTQKQQKQIQRMIFEFQKQMQKAMKLKNPIKQNNDTSLCEPSNTQRNSQLQLTIDRLLVEMSDYQHMCTQKDKEIKFLHENIKALREQQQQIRIANDMLEKQIDLLKNTDLSKTSKISNRQSLIKTQTLSKNGAKVFIINGKTYQSKLLSNKSDTTKSKELLSTNDTSSPLLIGNTLGANNLLGTANLLGATNLLGINNLLDTNKLLSTNKSLGINNSLQVKNSLQISSSLQMPNSLSDKAQNRKIIFHSGQISFISNPRTYQSHKQ